MVPTVRRPLLILPVLAIAASLALVACGRKKVGEYDTSTPEAAIEAMHRMIVDGHAELLPQMVHLEARDVEFDDGVTEASAIADVKGKAGEMLGRLWRISVKIRERWPKQVDREIRNAAKQQGLEEFITSILIDPFASLNSQREHLSAEDMTDGTAALLWKGEPIPGGFIRLVETPEGWRVDIPVELARGNRYWPDTRHEWAVVASMMLAIENSLKDFERELDSGRFKDLGQASARVGRLVGESVVAQSIIYAFMKRPESGSSSTPRAGDAPPGSSAPANSASPPG
ncbi:MAG: hypothetical protein FJ253_06125 [Phycisphaerae bacterium]|nr:hypothetical protein [Phycisphaerae bacterium]